MPQLAEADLEFVILQGFRIHVVNAAVADRVCLWHRMALCSAHVYAGSIASPGGGALPFWACSTTWRS